MVQLEANQKCEEQTEREVPEQRRPDQQVLNLAPLALAVYNPALTGL